MDTQFRLIVPGELAAELAKHPLGDARLVPMSEPPQKSLRLGLAEGAIIVSITLAAAQISKICFDIAEYIKKWKEKKKQDTVIIVVEGARDDARIEITDSWTSKQLADKIRGVLLDE